MIMNNNSQIQFKGFHNVLAHKIKTPNNDFCYISMQLDNVGTKDLDVWKYLQREILNRTEYSDVITFSKIENSPSQKTMMYLEDHTLNLDDIKFFPVYEKAYLKTFTLLASLTKRIQETKNLSKTPDILQIMNRTHINLTNFFGNPFSAYNATQSGVQGPIREIACQINTSIQKTMEKYLGII